MDNLQSNLSLDEVLELVAVADSVINNDSVEAFDFWTVSKIKPAQWSQKQYCSDNRFWVVAILHNYCLYFNPVEDGWGWGKYSQLGIVENYHWEQDELNEAFVWHYKEYITKS